MRMGGLDAVSAQMAVPAGALRSSWRRYSASRLIAGFSVPPGSGAATLCLPSLNMSTPTVTESGVPVP